MRSATTIHRPPRPLIQTLEADLGAIRELMMTTMTDLAGEVDSEVDAARDLIGRLLR